MGFHLGLGMGINGGGKPRPPVPWVAPVISGGTETEITILGTPWALLTFTTSVPVTIDIDGLLEPFVEGGGGSGGRAGGKGAGGGAGATPKIPGAVFLPAGTYNNTVGAGGAAITVATAPGNKGGSSTALAGSPYAIVAEGGGFGGDAGNGGNGSNGGGGGGNDLNETNSGGVGSDGYNGGASANVPTNANRSGGGGAGAGGAGGNASSAVGGTGGPPIYSDFSGVSTPYGEGGGGNATTGGTVPVAGGSPGATNAGNVTEPSIIGSGSGGGGGGAAAKGANGVIMYRRPKTNNFIWRGQEVTLNGKIMTYNRS